MPRFLQHGYRSQWIQSQLRRGFLLLCRGYSANYIFRRLYGRNPVISAKGRAGAQPTRGLRPRAPPLRGGRRPAGGGGCAPTPAVFWLFGPVAAVDRQ